MSMLEDISDRLAQHTLKKIEGVEESTLQRKVADAIGNSSPTLQEAYNTAMRIRKAEKAAMDVIESYTGE